MKLANTMSIEFFLAISDTNTITKQGCSGFLLHYITNRPILSNNILVDAQLSIHNILHCNHLTTKPGNLNQLVTLCLHTNMHSPF
jgi:hypothetical protein